MEPANKNNDQEGSLRSSEELPFSSFEPLSSRPEAPEPKLKTLQPDQTQRHPKALTLSLSLSMNLPRPPGRIDGTLHPTRLPCLENLCQGGLSCKRLQLPRLLLVLQAGPSIRNKPSKCQPQDWSQDNRERERERAGGGEGAGERESVRVGEQERETERQREREFPRWGPVLFG